MNLGRWRGRTTLAAALESQRGFTLIEVLITVVAILLISATLAPTFFNWVEESKVAKAQNDANAIAAAVSRFFQDTRRWPGQVEILGPGSAVRFLIVGSPATASFPDFTGFTGLGAVTCTSGLVGVNPNVTAFPAAMPSAGNTLDITDFLVRKPPTVDYPNWRGPYLNVDIRSDPWDRPWIINVIPLFCGETIANSGSGGTAGYGWILSAGPNGTLQTNLTSARLNPDADDLGAHLSKLVTRAP